MIVHKGGKEWILQDQRHQHFFEVFGLEGRIDEALTEYIKH